MLLYTTIMVEIFTNKHKSTHIDRKLVTYNPPCTETKHYTIFSSKALILE